MFYGHLRTMYSHTPNTGRPVWQIGHNCVRLSNVRISDVRVSNYIMSGYRTFGQSTKRPITGHNRPDRPKPVLIGLGLERLKSGRLCPDFRR